MNTFDNFQKEVGDWQRATFPASTRNSVVKHLMKEVQELHDSGQPEEVADCVLLLIAYAEKLGVSLFDVARDKFEIVKKRKWGAPNAEGFQEHVRDVHPSPAKKWYGTCLDCGQERPCSYPLHNSQEPGATK